MDVLGITNENLYPKLTQEIQKVERPTIPSEHLYGWGKNNYGQLASKAISTNYKSPLQISLPKFDSESDSISKIICGNRTTAIISAEGELWLSGNLAAEKHTQKPKKKHKSEKKQATGKIQNKSDQKSVKKN